MRDTKDTRSVTLFYANQTEAQIAFRDELESIEQGGHPSLKVVHVLSHAKEDWTGETGHIDKDMITRHCGEQAGKKVFYICGPPPLIKAVSACAMGLGASDEQIRLELFSFLD
jgi:NAD(P)H-flavin reductase